MANELTVAGEVIVEPEIVQYIVIKIGDEQYGIDIKYIDNIVRMQNITRVPKIAKYLKGVINLRGEVVAVMSLRLKMGLKDDEITKDSRIIIIKIGHDSIGIMVDSVKEVVNIDLNTVEKVGFENRDDSTFVQGIGKQENGALISLLDLNAVLSE
ncbi:MAG TPA: chemotaxis protein CheW [Lachnospiraceae bacterium]|jgi:purine-binding chemotaxis protein CheW|nr:chemotaxis protein CheW [Lachnospiraceae bacterium]